MLFHQLRDWIQSSGGRGIRKTAGSSYQVAPMDPHHHREAVVFIFVWKQCSLLDESA